MLAQRRGAARLVPLRDAGSAKLTAVAAEMLGDPSYRTAAERMREAFEKVDGPGAAVDAIVAFVGLTPRGSDLPS